MRTRDLLVGDLGNQLEGLFHAFIPDVRARLKLLVVRVPVETEDVEGLF